MRLFRRRRRGDEAPSAEKASPPPLSLPAGVRLAENLSTLWQALDAIAREDGLTGKSAVEHYNLTAEGKKDVERWLQIYLRRVHPDPAPSGGPGGESTWLPGHYHRHRGFCLVPRLWPDGLRWQAVNEETLFAAQIPEESDRAALIKALDRYLE